MALSGGQQKIKIGVVGLGMASTPHAKSLLDLSGRLEVRSVFSPNPARRAGFAARFGFTPADTLDALIDDPSIDAVLLLTPPNARLDIVERLAVAGKHVLMEKPVERTTEAARRIVELCARAKVKLGIVFQHRFRQSSMRLKEMIDAGGLGDLSIVQLSVPWWRPQAYYGEPGRGSYARDGGGVLISQAIHSMDLMLSLMGPVTEVAAVQGTSASHAMESEDFSAAGLRFANGAMGSLVATTAYYPGDQESIKISGSKATAILAGGTLDIYHHDGRHEHIGEAQTTGGGADPMDFPHDWHRAVIADFLDAIEQDREPAISGRDALAVHHLIDALTRSSHQRRHVRLDEFT